VENQGNLFKCGECFTKAVGLMGTSPDRMSAALPPTPTRGSRRWVYVGAAVAVIIVVVLAVVLSSAPAPPSGGSTGFVSEQTALATAAPFTNGASGGPWQLVQALGLIGGGPLSGSGLIPKGPSCVTRNNGTVTTIATPALGEPYYRGLTETWILWYANPNTDSELSLLVQNGTVAEIGEWSGSGCGNYVPVGTDLVDSTAAAEAATSTAVGSAFIADNPQANASYNLFSNVTYHVGSTPKTASLWVVRFGMGIDEFSAEVFATNSTLLCTGGGLPCS
jgi:hypothetical protein